MLNTYRAILRGKTLEWVSDGPTELPSDRAIPVHVTILEETPEATASERGLRMVDALEKLAHLPSSLTSLDPVQWEREMRQERPLPGRKDNAD